MSHSLVIYGALWVLLLSACSASDDAVETPTAAPWEKVQTPQSFMSMSEEDAIEAARVNTGKVIAASPLQEATAELTTWAGAYAGLADRGLDKPSNGPWTPPDETAVWLAILKGMFYEPQGPEPPPGPQEAVCAEIVVILVDPKANIEGRTELASELSFLPAEGCD